MKFALDSASMLATMVLSTLLVLGHPAISYAVTPAKSPVAKASEPTPGVLERTEKAAKKAAHATAEAISDTGKAIDAKVPRTEAYKKKHPKEVPSSSAN